VKDSKAKELKEFQGATKEAGDTIRNVARWVVGGVMVAAGGVIAGSSLTSMGSLSWGWRLQLAAAASAIGLCLLLYLMWSALDVITPRSYSVDGILNGKDITPRRLKIIDARVKGFFPSGVKTFQEFVETGMKLIGESKEEGASPAVVQKAEEYDGAAPFVKASMIYEHLLVLFAELRLRVVIVTPLIALSFGVFAWAANPPRIP
jgi:hypothetical protein